MAEHMVISSLVAAIAKFLVEEAKFLPGVKDQVEELLAKLSQLQWFLGDASAKKIDTDRIQRWILEVKDIAYDAEDLVEKYAFQVRYSCRSWRDGRCVCLLYDCYVRHKIGSEILTLNKKILNLENSFKAHGIRAIIENEGSSSTQQRLRRTYSFVEEEDFVGLGKDVDFLVRLLVSENDHCRVVSISGMGGLGKTTLANKVYNHRSVRRYFSGRAWICVSQQWQVKDILQSILVKLVPEMKQEIEKQYWREDDLIRELFGTLQRMKCLIVLDDIWTKDAWDSIKAAFPTGQKGTNILLTTRNREVALHIDPDAFNHQPQFLSNDESWELLWSKALRKRCEKGHDQLMTNLNEMEKLGKEMVKHCGGLPLAIVVLGGILSTKNLNEWKTVNKNIKAHLMASEGIGKDKGKIHHILALSYHDLPYQLKPCFLYLGSFPEDSDIDANTLYQLWIAEGMVLREDLVGKESMMALAERYLGELGQRAMVQLQALTELQDNRRFKSFRLHDLMREMCLLVGEQEGFLKSLNSSIEREDSESLSVSTPRVSKLRRLVINLDMDMFRHISPEKEITKCLRMLRLMASNIHNGCMVNMIKSQLNCMEMLRVLSIEDLCPRYEKYDYGLQLLKAVGKLIHLRYLSLKNSTFYLLPSSLGNLKHLQTLDLRVSSIVHRLSNILWKMKELTSLYLPDRIKTPPSKIRHDGLNKLEILENFDDGAFCLEDLIKLTNLRVLRVSHCFKLENLAVIANCTQINERLESVSINTFCDFNLDREKGLRVLKQLLYGRNIHYFNAEGAMWKFPQYKSNMSSSLVELSIHDSWLDVDEVICKALEKFNNLRKLTLSGLCGKEMSFHASGFPQLLELELYKLEELEEWVVEEGALPKLRTLKMLRCPKLKVLPIGLRFMTTLEYLDIKPVAHRL